MKSLYSIALALLMLISCDKDDHTAIDYDNIALDTFILNHYTEDAKQLYFNEIYNDSTHENFNNPILDTNEIIKILKIIQIVYNSNSPQRDTIFERYQIHGYYCYSFRSISLKVQTELPEIQNLANGIIPTGETDLDHLLTMYNFDSVKTSYSYPGFPWLTIYTSEEYNMIPIENSFNELPSIIIAEFNRGCIGDGNSISMTRNIDSATIIFSIGDGDCPAGCTYHKYWEFRVENGGAKFVRTYSD